jgi:hypothetical protein
LFLLLAAVLLRNSLKSCRGAAIIVHLKHHGKDGGDWRG